MPHSAVSDLGFTCLLMLVVCPKKVITVKYFFFFPNTCKYCARVCGRKAGFLVKQENCVTEKMDDICTWISK